MNHSSRRSFLRHAGIVTAAFAGLQRWAQGAAQADAKKLDEKLKPDFYGVIDLPEGFSYTIFSEAGETMSDGLLVPGKHDGMGAFAAPNGKTILVRNHELDPTWTDQCAWGKKRALFKKVDRRKLYDAGKGKKPGLGGTTTVHFDTKTGTVERQFLSLAGTYMNCAGGVMPWGSWITCEEHTQNAEDDVERDHGYNFEVPASAMGLVDPIPLKPMGRMRHEAVAYEPKSGIIYQTEDRYDGMLYRFIPNERQKLAAGGKLQALRIKDQKRADTRNWFSAEPTFKTGEKHAVEWVDIQNVESPDDDLRYQGYYDGNCARFARGEGTWTGKDAIYFACTNGGKKRKGQVWRYHPSASEGTAGETKQPGHVELFIEPNDGALVENCDNLTMAPWGDLIICEDGTNPQCLVGVRPDGSIYKLGRTSISELAGACFSPDGTTLFVNVQTPGMTVAITGPWKELASQK
jgi:uncharacterized protein